MAGVLIDSEEDCRTRGRELRKGNLESRAFRVERVRHAWHLRRATIVMLDKGMRFQFCYTFLSNNSDLNCRH
jgi:hypothetical protein